MQLGILSTIGFSKLPLRCGSTPFNSCNISDSVAQKYMNGRVVSQPRGKVLGGSRQATAGLANSFLMIVSAINGMMCTYSSKEDIDSWEKLGNKGWSHADLAPYYKKFASFTQPSKKTAEFYHIDSKVIDKGLHGSNGPVRTAFTNSKRVGGNAWVKTFDKLGLRMTADPQSGHGNGGYRLVLASISLDMV